MSVISGPTALRPASFPGAATSGKAVTAREHRSAAPPLHQLSVMGGAYGVTSRVRLAADGGNAAPGGLRAPRAALKAIERRALSPRTPNKA